MLRWPCRFGPEKFIRYKYAYKYARWRCSKGNSNGPAAASSPAAKHKSPAKGDSVGGKNFSGNKFRQELYAFSKNKDRVKVIDQYAAVLEKEWKKHLGEPWPLPRQKI